MPKAFLVLKDNEIVNKIVTDDPDAVRLAVESAFAGETVTIKEFDDPNDPAFVNSNNSDIAQGVLNA